MKLLSALIASILLISSGKQNRSTQRPREQPPTNRTSGVSQAMQLIYGNYDTSDQSSTASLRSEESAGPSQAANERMKVRSLFSTFVDARNKRTFVIATYAVPIDEGSFECHACAPTIGMAIFSVKGSQWTIESSNQAVTRAGEWGMPPSGARLVSIGSKHVGVMLRVSNMAFGESSERLLILSPWRGSINLGLDRVIADDNQGECGSEEGAPCYSNRRTFRFLRSGKEEYFRLELKLIGTDLPLSDLGKAESARRVHGLETFKFENGRYFSVSRQGDITYLDSLLAEHSGDVSPKD